MSSNDQAVRNLIGRVRSRTCEPGTDHEAYDLAKAAEGLIRERDSQAQDFYASNRRIAYLEDEVERLESVLADIRRMTAAFETPRDPRRVTAFVGDLRQLVDKASRKG